MLKIHRFTLILSGVAELTSELSDRLFEATKGDIEFNTRDGIAFVEFERFATILSEAIRTAIDDVENAGLGIRVVRVEPEAANTIAKINADLLGSPTSG
ncbi:MAG TPA: hypothetical protein VJ783_13890 [Pirellulales bacterium]|nr:hypothetical protein [Pirellulales bacterium]